MALSLTREQKEKLQKLDEEIKLKKEYELKNRSRKEASSKATGIPIDIVDMDVIKIGTLLGLIKKKSILEGKEPNTTNYLLDLFLGSDSSNTVNFDHSKIPQHYKTTQQKVNETEKIEYHQEFVQKQCTYFSEITMNTIKSQIDIIQKHILINLGEMTISHFISTINENIEVIFDELCNNVIQNEEDEREEDELWATLSILRNSLLGPLNICEYKKKITDQIFILRERNKPHKKILNHLSLIEARLILYPGSLQTIKGPLSQTDLEKLIKELQFRAYTKNPQLKPFEISDLTKHCCTPSLLNLPLDVVIKISMLGPYMNNSIGYLNDFLNTNGISSKEPWSFYVISRINEDGSRLWVLDYKIRTFSQFFISSLITYLIKIFRIFYKEIFKTNNYIPHFYNQTKTHHFDSFSNMIKNIIFISKQSLFVEFLKDLIIQKSCIIPTQYDFFNHLTYYDDHINEPKCDDLTILKTNIESLFDTPVDPDALKLFLS